MRWLRFLTFNALGAALWVATWVSVGDLAGGNIATIYSYITRYSYYALIALAVVIAALHRPPSAAAPPYASVAHQAAHQGPSAALDGPPINMISI